MGRQKSASIASCAASQVLRRLQGDTTSCRGSFVLHQMEQVQLMGRSVLLLPYINALIIIPAGWAPFATFLQLDPRKADSRLNLGIRIEAENNASCSSQGLRECGYLHESKLHSIEEPQPCRQGNESPEASLRI